MLCLSCSSFTGWPNATYLEKMQQHIDPCWVIVWTHPITYILRTFFLEIMAIFTVILDFYGIWPFLVACTRLYNPLRRSVGRSVCRSVGRSVTLCFLRCFWSFWVIWSYFESFFCCFWSFLVAFSHSWSSLIIFVTLSFFHCQISHLCHSWAFKIVLSLFKSFWNISGHFWSFDIVFWHNLSWLV